jgi:hypothetical protein
MDHTWFYTTTAATVVPFQVFDRDCVVKAMYSLSGVAAGAACLLQDSQDTYASLTTNAGLKPQVLAAAYTGPASGTNVGEFHMEGLNLFLPQGIQLYVSTSAATNVIIIYQLNEP